ncbi:hypothetical protein L1267_22945 [Pseudoalteromonas sp. OFAV1]|uniref:hypothetical protein n=1 Tax=Pseudoalteromonas sp. OFAV1 TaxID=2908892 RepID=UPI001F254A48|nr:hypothetical protein [Pseudoalteromonas sp. OFAV1]MCF2903229.1 hypothetical protein [Pseudoalteromonas sp. OFAV1]
MIYTAKYFTEKYKNLQDLILTATFDKGIFCSEKNRSPIVLVQFLSSLDIPSSYYIHAFKKNGRTNKKDLLLFLMNGNFISYDYELNPVTHPVVHSIMRKSDYFSKLGKNACKRLFLNAIHIESDYWLSFLIDNQILFQNKGTPYPLLDKVSPELIPTLLRFKSEGYVFDFNNPLECFFKTVIEIKSENTTELITMAYSLFGYPKLEKTTKQVSAQASFIAHISNNLNKVDFASVLDLIGFFKQTPSILNKVTTLVFEYGITKDKTLCSLDNISILSKNEHCAYSVFEVREPWIIKKLFSTKEHADKWLDLIVFEDLKNIKSVIKKTVSKELLLAILSKAVKSGSFRSRDTKPSRNYIKKEKFIYHILEQDSNSSEFKGCQSKYSRLINEALEFNENSFICALSNCNKEKAHRFSLLFGINLFQLIGRDNLTTNGKRILLSSISLDLKCPNSD